MSVSPVIQSHDEGLEVLKNVDVGSLCYFGVRPPLACAPSAPLRGARTLLEGTDVAAKSNENMPRVS